MPYAKLGLNHIVASGDLEQLRALAQTLNTMPNYSSGFGRYWMGNLAAALLGVDADGLDRYRGMHLRGTLDPDFYAQACLCGPYVDQKREFEVDEDGTMRFSTTSAWDRSEDLENLILDKFPGINDPQTRRRGTGSRQHSGSKPHRAVAPCHHHRIGAGRQKFLDLGCSGGARRCAAHHQPGIHSVGDTSHGINDLLAVV